MKKSFRSISILLILVFFALALSATLRANLDAAAGRYVLHMDENISYQEVLRLYSANSFGDFWNTYLGVDQRYGRLFYGIAALVSYIPSQIFGATGQIVGTRMAAFPFIALSILILSWSLFSSWQIRVLAVFALSSLPNSVYFLTMPKPEPYQLFFLALFFLFNFHQKLKWQLMSSLCLGLAFGLKVSTLPFALCVLGLFVYKNKSILGWSQTINLSLANIGAFVVGWVFAVPTLIYGNYNLYMNWTFRNIGHGADDDKVSVLNWIQNDWEKVFTNFKIGIIFCFLMLLGIFVFYFKQIIRSDTNFRNRFLLLAASAATFTLPPILSVKRIWPHYLYIGLFFSLLLILFLLEDRFKKSEKGAQRSVSIFLFVLIGCFSAIGISSNARELQELSVRSSQEEYKFRIEQYEVIQNFISKYAEEKKLSSLRVIQDPFLFMEDKTALATFSNFWGPFLNWDQGYDLVIYEEILCGESEEPATSGNAGMRSECQKSQDLRRSHVSLDGKTCASKPCYQKLLNQSKVLIYGKLQ